MITSPDEWRRIKEIADEALSRDPSERPAYVSGACGPDLHLRRQVEMLLSADQRAGAFLEMPARLPRQPSANENLIGRTIGSYTLSSWLGAGGMGEVYQARDAKLERPVALKLLSREFAADADRLRRFHQEARAASSLNHPHILVIHDFGEVDGRPFIVSELVEGQTLRQRLRQGVMPLGDAVDITLQVASALAAAHARGIVHRDVKPENVMVRPDGYVKVLDFGLAKLAAPLLRDETDPGLLTKPGTTIGTPQYMSPEQARGIDVDARSDVWSLGVMLYEMGAGRTPFGGATPADMIAAVLNSEPVPFELQVPQAPPALARIVAKALRKDRLERYGSCRELAADLAAVKRQFDSHEPPAPGAGVAAAAETTSPRSRLATRTRLVVLPFRILRPDPEFDFLGFSLADAIATTLSGLDSLIVRSSMTATRFAAEQPDFKTLAREAEVDAVLAGTLLRSGSLLRITAQVVMAPQGTIVWSDRVDAPVDDIIRVQDELSRRIVDALALPLTAGEQESLRRDVPASAKAYELYLRGNSHFYDAENWTIARDLFIECVQEDPAYAPAWARLGRCYRLTAKFRSATVDEMRDNLRRAEVAFRKAFELNPDLPLAHHLYTALETDLGRAEEAMLRLIRRARQRRGDPELYAGLVHACRYCGLLDASVAAHDRARQLDPHISTGVANTYFMQGQYEHAIDGLTGFFVGTPQAVLGRDGEAIAAARAFAAVVRDPRTRLYQSILPLMLEGQTDACIRLLDELAPRNPDPESVFYIARTYARCGALDRAVVQFDRAVNMGFLCCSTFARDPWLDPIRSNATFAEALARAERRRADASRAFREAGGDRLLGLA